MKKFISISVVLLFSIFSIGGFVKADTLPEATGRIVEYSVPSEVHKNVRQTNYRVLSDWYYGYSYFAGFNYHGNGVGREIKVYYRKVSYTLEYDVYSAIGQYLRHERKPNIVTYEEQYR